MRDPSSLLNPRMASTWFFIRAMRGERQSQFLHDHGRKLIAHGFPTTCRHDDEGVLPRQHISNDALLFPLNLSKPKYFLR